MVFKNKLWVIGGYSDDNQLLNDVWSSNDGINWNLAVANAAFPARRSHALTTNGKRMWLTAGTKNNNFEYYNDAWYSTDGVNWIEANVNNPFPERQQHASVFYDKKLWVIAGYALVNGNSSDYFSDVWSLE